jgi:hypothetical protein
MPATGGAAPRGAAGTPRAPFLRRWGVLIATLIAGVVVLVLIALLWSRAPSTPNPQSLPPAFLAPAAI